MKEYDRVRRELESFLEVADGEDYDAVYYYIGEKDFDQTDALSIELVADLILEKATQTKPNPYTGSGLVDPDEILFSTTEGAPENICGRAAERAKRKEAAEARRAVYIPDSSQFRKFIEMIILAGMDMPEYASKFFFIWDYNRQWKNCFNFVKNAAGDDYDAIYYFIGKHDFDQTNDTIIEAVVDLIYEKLSHAESGKKFEYITRRVIDINKATSQNTYNVPDNVLDRMITREKKEKESVEIKHRTYVPDSEEFIHILGCMSVSFTITEEIEVRDKMWEKYGSSDRNRFGAAECLAIGVMIVILLYNILLMGV